MKLGILLDITTKCPHKCIYCYHQKNKLLKPSMMYPKDFDSILEILVKEKFQTVHLYMSGEPLAHPSFYYFLIQLGKARMRVNVATKAALPIDEGWLIEAYKYYKTPPAHLRWLIEVPAWSQESAKKICLMNWKQERENLRMFGSQVGEFKNISFSITTIVTKWNQFELPVMKKGLHRMGFKSWTPKKPGYYMSSPGPENWLPDAPYDSRMKKAWADKCPFPKNIAIATNGDLSVCCHDMLFQMSMGNVIEEGTIKGILARNKTIMEKRLLKQLPICRRCN